MMFLIDGLNPIPVPFDSNNKFISCVKSPCITLTALSKTFFNRLISPKKNFSPSNLKNKGNSGVKAFNDPEAIRLCLSVMMVE